MLTLIETLARQVHVCISVLFLFQGKTFEYILFLEQKYFFPLSDRLSELTYGIHFGTLMAKGMLPAETTFF